MTLKSILDGRPELKAEIEKIAEIAGYLWQKGWAERNGGNITVNITRWVDDGIRAMEPISNPVSIGVTLPCLRGCYFYCKGTGRRMRDLARQPMRSGSIIRMLDDCASYVIIADEPVMPTSELPSHLAVHDFLLKSGSGYTASLHTHPIELVAMSHNSHMLKPGVMTRLLWSMIPETLAFAPLGLGVVPYCMPGSLQLAEQSLKQIANHDVVMWEKHGVLAVGEDIVDAFDQIDVLNKAACIYMSARSMGFEPDGMTDEAMEEVRQAFRLPDKRLC